MNLDTQSLVIGFIFGAFFAIMLMTDPRRGSTEEEEDGEA